MNTITEARQDSSGSKTQGGSGSQPKPGLGELWLAILALAAVVGLVAAVALGALDNSSKTETVNVVDPVSDTHFFPENPAAAPAMDADAIREINQRASKADASSAVDPVQDTHLFPAPAANQGMDSDTHRELNQQASKADAQPPYVSGGITPYSDTDGDADVPQDPTFGSDHVNEGSNG